MHLLPRLVKISEQKKTRRVADAFYKPCLVGCSGCPGNAGEERLKEQLPEEQRCSWHSSCLRPSVASILVHVHSAGVACYASSAVVAAADGKHVPYPLDSAGTGSCAAPAVHAVPAEASHSAAAAAAAMADWLVVEPEGGNLHTLGTQHLHATKGNVRSCASSSMWGQCLRLFTLGVSVVFCSP